MTTENGTQAADLDLFNDSAATVMDTKADAATTIPDKFKGKTVEELIQMNLNATRKISEQGAELGTLRRVVDHSLLGLNKAQDTPKREEPPVTVESLLNDPAKALQGAIDKGLASARSEIDSLKASLSHRDFATAYPDYAKDMQDPDFTAFVQKTPLRQALGNRAAKDDFQAAKSLWDEWKEYKDIVGTRQETPSADVRRTKAAAIDTVKSAPRTASTERTYSRAKINELRYKMLDGDPAAVDRWKDPVFQRNLIQAYQDERVK